MKNRNTDKQESHKENSREAIQQPSRRQLFSSMGALGVVGGLGMASFSPRLFAQSGYDFEQPQNLRPGAQVDSRFPVSFAEPVTEGLRLVIAFFTALNQRDVAGMADTLHFPFAIYEDIEPLVYQSRADFLSNPPPTLNASGRGFTRIAEDSYDLLENVNIHLYCPVGGVYSLDYSCLLYTSYHRAG